MDTAERPKLEPATRSSNTSHEALGAEREQPPVDNLIAQVTQAADQRRRRILLADDSADNLFLLQSYLKRMDVEVDEAQDGNLALEKFMSGLYDLVLMDVHMPVMDGLAAIREMREFEARKTLKSTPIVALTASVFGEDIDKCLEAGADMYVSKPIKRAALLEVVTRLLERDSSHASSS